MRTNIYISFLYLLSNLLHSQVSDSTKNFRFILHHDIIGTPFYFAAKPKNTTYTQFDWIYLTGGIGIKKKNNSLLFDYLFLRKDEKHINGGVSPDLFSDSSTFESAKSIYFFLSLNHQFNISNYSKLFINFGFGGGQKKFITNKSPYTISESWCNVIDFGYSFNKWKKLKLNPYFGVLNSFCYRKTSNFKADNGYSANNYMNKEIGEGKVNNIRLISENKVIESFKYIGLLNASFIFRVGIDISYEF